MENTAETSAISKFRLAETEPSSMFLYVGEHHLLTATVEQSQRIVAETVAKRHPINPGPACQAARSSSCL